AGALGRLGARDVPAALRHRVELPAVEPGADPHQQPLAVAAAAVRGLGAGAAQRVGLVALGGAVPPAPGQAPRGCGPVAVACPAALVASGRGSALGGEGSPRVGTPVAAVSYTKPPPVDRTWIYWRPLVATRRAESITEY